MAIYELEDDDDAALLEYWTEQEVNNFLIKYPLPWRQAVHHEDWMFEGAPCLASASGEYVPLNLIANYIHSVNRTPRTNPSP